MHRHVLALATGALLILTGCDEPGAPAPIDRTFTHDLAVQAIAPATVPKEIRFDGVIEAVSEATVSAQTGGRVMELPYDVGDFVPAGSLIVKLTDSEQKSRVDATKGALEEAEALHEEARLAHGRNEELFERKLIAKSQLDRTAAALGSAEARVNAARAALAEAEETLSYTKIHAPYSGIVVTRHVQIGESVSPGTPLMTGLALADMRASVDVPQEHINAITAHDEARLILPNGRSIAAARLRIPPRAEAGSQTFRVLTELPDDARIEIFPGTLVKVAFTIGETEQLLLPASAVARRGEITGAYTVDDSGRVSFRYIRIGDETMNGNVPVLAGLESGDRVALDPDAAAILYKRQAETP